MSENEQRADDASETNRPVNQSTIGSTVAVEGAKLLLAAIIGGLVTGVGTWLITIKDLESRIAVLEDRSAERTRGLDAAYDRAQERVEEVNTKITAATNKMEQLQPNLQKLEDVLDRTPQIEELTKKDKGVLDAAIKLANSNGAQFEVRMLRVEDSLKTLPQTHLDPLRKRLSVIEGFPRVAVGMTRTGTWRPHDLGMKHLIQMDVQTSHGLRKPIYLTTLYGTKSSFELTGMTSLYRVGDDGFTVHVRNAGWPSKKMLDTANGNGKWRISWLAVETPD